MYHYLHLAIPIAGQGLLLELLSSVDLALAGRLTSEVQAGIAINSQPRMLLMILARAVSVALTAVLARRYGQGRRREFADIFRQTLLVIASFYFLIILVAIIFWKQILLLVGAQEAYLSSALVYGRVTLIGVFFSVLALIINCAFIAVGNSRLIFVAHLSGNIVDVILNFVFIYGWFGLPKMGALGLALSTTIGNLITFLIVTLGLFNPSLPFRVDWKVRKLDFKRVEPVFRLLGGSFWEQVFERIGMLLYTMMVTSLGTIELASHHIAMTLCDIFYSLLMGLGTASTSMTGKMLGQKDPEGARAYGGTALLCAASVGVFALLVFIKFGAGILSLFTTSAEVMAVGQPLMWKVGLASLFSAFALVYSGVLKGAGDTRYVATYSLIIIAFMRPIVTYLLVIRLGMGLDGAWYALLMDQCLRALASGGRYYRGDWLHIEL